MTIQSVKTIAGKRYMLKGHYNTKPIAKAMATQAKRKGWRGVRRVDGKEAGYDGGYAVYVRDYKK